MAIKVKNMFKRMGIAIMRSRLEYAKRQVALLGYPEVIAHMKQMEENKGA